MPELPQNGCEFPEKEVSEVEGALSFHQRIQTPLLSRGHCDCHGTNNTGVKGKDSICNDPRLGPKELPKKLPLLSFVSDYDRFGGQKPGDFLAKWTNATTGWWVYPEKDGYYLDLNGNPIVGNMTLQVGALVDRFGEETGKYVSAADSPYDQRSLPPNNLNTSPDGIYPNSYHVYMVAKPLVVEGGPIAPWFGQPGLGAQFYIGRTGSVEKLIELGYLERVHKSDVKIGPGNGGDCGL
ncbi:uncharacterized protein KY384_001334 [Bacidia gigantensis]|uniref:uncharacterized protein n=1 Tax=Bacidia gigantensis TaxID=2732470 RepID=UPI001D04503B|nr:uncharacterized protein KY384_001334 [Bacidia gigantensis]KAG8533594.1 hypothetical protein KY384_001334 [Bacidia gigantensis]